MNCGPLIAGRGLHFAGMRPATGTAQTDPQSATRDPQSEARDPRPAILSWLPALISIAYLVTISYAARAHPFGTYTTETDFYHLYAPDADRLAAGQFPENTFQGPGYPLVVALVAVLTGDVFTAGKSISVVSAAAAGLLAFLLFGRLFGYSVGVGAQLILLVGNLFPQFSVAATTDMFFLALCLAALVVFTAERASVHTRVVATAALASFAYLTRYNGMFLVASALFAIMVLDLFGRSPRGRLKLSGIFLGVFFLVASPWLYANYRHNGSPFYNTSYLNIATEFYGELAGDNIFQEGTRQMSTIFHSLSDVLAYDPWRMISHYPVNLWDVISRSVTSDLVSPVVGWLAVAGLALALLERRSKAVMFVLASGAFYFLVLAFTHWETRYYLFIMALYSGLAVYAVFGGLERLRQRGPLGRRTALAAGFVILAGVWASSFALAGRDIRKFLASHPTEVLAACGYFKSAGVAGARVMSRKPHLAYICGQQWVYTPNVKSLDELREWIRENPVDFVAVGAIEISRRPALAPLRAPSAAPAWLKPVWVNEDPLLILYRPQPAE
jgi:hypothetical protein